MKKKRHLTKSTASELGILWSQYINDSLSRCILRYFLFHIEDEQIKDVVQNALTLSEAHLEKIKQFLSLENYPIPIGFTDDDVTVDAPTLFTDTYIIMYVQVMSIHGMTRYAGAVGSSLRADYIKYFIDCTNETMDLYTQSSRVVLEKGIITKAPTLNNQPKVDFIQRQSFLTGWLGSRRPINAVEISGTYLNLQKTMAKMVLELGFSQVAESKKVREYMERGRQVCHKHFKRLSTMLEEDNLHVPKTFETEVTDSIVPPFSDKLMMYHVTTLLSSAIAYYGEALALCQRRDLSAAYFRMITEIGVIAEDGVNILIDNGWMEQPPTATDHGGLSKNK
ncbi:DUF3231 family protein [Pseudalkalibacillus hwajinpoensis]|uniref:DUF3231 family protein n=1 Tax=Guptibacillus hwajinpoensis TaxID=208199 RepID=A0A4U1MNB8_9BACL|nr:DUF3231 family protein [Pseudalkalibacillus hwajinpoensis]TKD72226.1 DUF3231 family protein [Pseudalkalibacillus hwajinpoensis]